MPLTNAEKQKRWRAAHGDRRRTVQRIATLLMRHSHPEGHTDEITVGWYTTKVDAYFFKLADLICDALGTDKEIRQLKNALAYYLDRRQSSRREHNWRERRWREHWLRDHPHMTAKEYRRWRNTDEMAAWRKAVDWATTEMRRERQAMEWALDG
jgi:hypothetical protein